MFVNRINLTKLTLSFDRWFNKTKKSFKLLKNEIETHLPLHDKDLPNGFTFKSEFSIE